ADHHVCRPWRFRRNRLGQSQWTGHGRVENTRRQPGLRWLLHLLHRSDPRPVVHRERAHKILRAALRRNLLGEGRNKMARPRCLAAILSVAITASLPSLGNAAVPENTVSHGGVTVPLSGQFYCDWPKAAMTHQPPDCPTLSICPVGCRDRKLPLNTPAPSTFTSWSQCGSLQRGVRRWAQGGYVKPRQSLGN